MEVGEGGTDEGCDIILPLISPSFPAGEIFFGAAAFISGFVKAPGTCWFIPCCKNEREASCSSDLPYDEGSYSWSLA